VSGPGSTRTTWIESWRPLDLLLLLGVCVLIGRMISPWAGALALLGLGLAYTRSGDGYVALVLLIAIVTILAAQLRRAPGPLATRALQWLWVAGAGLLAAWMIWTVPVGLREVWQGGESALAHRDLERELGQLAELELVGAALVLVVYGLAWMIARTRGAGHKVAVGLGVFVGGAMVVGLVLTTTQRGMNAAPTSASVEEEAPPEEWEHTDEEAGGSGQRHKGEEGKMGRPTSKSKSGLYAMKGPKDAVGTDNDVWGGLRGEEVGEAYGVGGLGLVGTGRGGGGTGEGTIGLGNTGLIGKGGGDGTGTGYGRGGGAGFGGRGGAVPTVRQGKATVSGALDRDVIRRIVRAHINEVRYCYNQGLARDPAIGGRVTVNFTIDANGKVNAAVVSETTVKDAAVGTCIAQAIRRWTFPKPKSGVVEVSYPFVLESDNYRGGGDAAPADERYVLEADLPKAPPSALPQTGEGTPEWSGRRWSLDIDHAVKTDETVSMWLLSPTASKALALLRALALWILGFALVRAGWRAGWGRTPRESVSPTRSSGASRAVAVIAVLLGALLGGSQVASAAPTPELLEALKERVTAERPQAPEPECAPDCALVVRLGVEVAARTLRLRAEVHMAGPGVYQLPGSFESWMARTVDVDGRPAEELIAIDGVVFVRLAEGVHVIALAGPIGVDELNLGLTDEPKRVDIKAKGWVVEGVDEDGHAASLHLVAEAAAASESADDGGAESGEPGEPGEPAGGDRVSQDLPAWLSVDRTIEIGPRWTVRTLVTRQNHGPSPITVQVPLLAGEKMIESTAKVSDPKATVSLDQAGATISWVSVLEPRDTLVLAAPQGSPWTERWTVTCGEAWQCAMTGMPATRVDTGTSVFHPWPGETLSLTLHQPPAIDGPLLTVDRADLRVKLADAGTEARLAMLVRAATVTTRTVTLPAAAHLRSVKVAGAEVPMARDATELRLPLQPGVSEVIIEWKQDDGVQAVYTAPSVSLGGAAVNARVAIDFVDDSERVILWTGGSADGPIVWLWPWFGALVLLAVVLGRAPGVPLKSWKWLVLGLGFGAGFIPLIAAWFLLVASRPTLVRRVSSDHGYNALQFGFALLTAAVLMVTLATGQALLTSPVWTLVDNWSADDGLLRWYADRVEDATPSAWVVSVPASLWRALWVLWALWVAWQSIGWGRWAWRAIGEGGWLRISPPPVEDADIADEANAPGPTNAPAVSDALKPGSP
jgi:TonB family protein